MMMLKPAAAALMAATLAVAGTAYAKDTMTREAYKAEKDRIDAKHESARKACDSLSGNAKDVCQKEAKAAQRIAHADLDARNKATAEAQERARMVRAEAEYDVAREKCDDLSGNVKDTCVKDAKAAEAKAKAEAKANRRIAEAKSDARERTAEARKDAAEDTREAQLSAARERCDQFSGEAKDSCLRDVRAKFGRP